MNGIAKTLKNNVVNYMVVPGIPLPDRRLVTLEDIISTVCYCCSISVEKLMRGGRMREVVEARQIYCYIARKHLPGSTLSSIAKTIKRDYTTVIHSIRSVENIMHVDKEYAYRVEWIERKIIAKKRSVAGLVFQQELHTIGDT